MISFIIQTSTVIISTIQVYSWWIQQEHTHTHIFLLVCIYIYTFAMHLFHMLIISIYIYIWSNYSDLTRPHPQKVASWKGNPLGSGKCRWRWHIMIWPDIYPLGKEHIPYQSALLVGPMWSFPGGYIIEPVNQSTPERRGRPLGI